METTLEKSKIRESLHVLLVGNNPTEIECILNKLNKIRSTHIVTEVAFDLKTTLGRLTHFKPNYILLDDNIGMEELNHAVKKLISSKHTKNVPITVIKNSNYSASMVSSDVLDFVMKRDLSAETLINAVNNAFKFRRTQLYLYDTYRRRSHLMRLVNR